MRALLTATAFTLMTIIAGPVAAGTAEPAGSGMASDRETVTLRVDNMFCAACPYIVRKVLLSVPGVTAAEVSFRDRRAVVRFDPAQTDPEALMAATEGVGYPSHLIAGERPGEER